MARQSPKKKRTKNPKKTPKQSPTRKLQQPTWQARRKLLAELFDEAFQDNAICAARDEMLALFQQGPLAVGPVDSRQRLDLTALTEEHVAHMFYESPDLARWYYEFTERRRHILELAQKRVPQLQSFTDAELVDVLAETAFPLPDPWRKAAHYLAPDVPIKVLPTGAVEIPPRSRLTNPQWGQVRDFVHSQNPGKIGRPRKNQSMPSKTPSKKDEEREALAALAYKNEQNGIDWKETARKVCPHYNLYDEKQGDAARKFVKRLVFKGEDLALRKLKALRRQKKSDA
jgi:hypothetical protein